MKNKGIKIIIGKYDGELFTCDCVDSSNFAISSMSLVTQNLYISSIETFFVGTLLFHILFLMLTLKKINKLYPAAEKAMEIGLVKIRNIQFQEQYEKEEKRKFEEFRRQEEKRRYEEYRRQEDETRRRYEQQKQQEKQKQHEE